MSLQAQCVRRQNDMCVVLFTFVVFSGRVDTLVTSWILTAVWPRSLYVCVTISYRSLVAVFRFWRHGWTACHSFEPGSPASV